MHVLKMFIIVLFHNYLYVYRLLRAKGGGLQVLPLHKQQQRSELLLLQSDRRFNTWYLNYLFPNNVMLFKQMHYHIYKAL